ncbi:unnamed protein product [Nippostrongylus brasiliensis]|uniref:Secreted protein n=1 Tax=Nippostrongylus brasiliensis TaxID=27835 RepID=A0A0N4Y1V7_NIPBR|nr:unnamed protein product [Nippostrongylus brasiliensis]
MKRRLKTCLFRLCGVIKNIINCFPYPSPRTTPQQSPVIICEHIAAEEAATDKKGSFGDAFEQLVQDIIRSIWWAEVKAHR